MSNDDSVTYKAEPKRDVKKALEKYWTPGEVDGRRSVPEPEIVVEGDDETRSVSYADNDVVFVQDGGFPVVEPAGVGHEHEKIEAVIDVQIRTSHSEERFYGHPEDSGYGGLVGEMKRVFDALRKGFGPYDRLGVETFDDQIGDYGADTWVGVWTVRTYQYANIISERSVRYE